MNGHDVASLAWQAATPYARNRALSGHLAQLGEIPFSLDSLSKMNRVDELLAACPGAPIGEQTFLDALQSAPDPLPDGSIYPNINFGRITIAELDKARLTPRCIVPELLYADVRTRISAGGTGKTTAALFEAVSLALGRTLWGRTPEGHRKTAIVTREDSREILAARMREVMRCMNLSNSDIEQVLDNVRVIDASGERFRLTEIIGDVVEPSTFNIEYLLEFLTTFKPDWLIFDPLVSFGTGESRVNDSEHGLIEAFRIFRNRLDCCVETIHHSGKANAREKNVDQYAGRGGSALSDGCRMVAVMQPLDAGEWQQATGTRLLEGETGIVMALPKLSYAKPQPSVYILRRGYHFETVATSIQTAEQMADAIADQVFNFIRYEYSQGHHYCMADLENIKATINLSRNEIRAAVTQLRVSGRIVYHQIKGKTGSHFEPVTLADGNGDTRGESHPNGR